MKKVFQHLLITAVALLAVFPVAAQPKITLNHLGVPTSFSNLPDAHTAAQDGDTLFLSGGLIQPYSDFTINKSLHIVGTGHYPDSTTATNTTMIYTLRFLNGAGGGSIEGCVINDLYIGYAENQNFTGFSVKRCSVGNLYLGYDNVSTFESIFLTDNVFQNYVIIKDGYPNIVITRNIFNLMNCNAQGLLFKNNIMYTYYAQALMGLSNCVLENNIIINTDGAGNPGPYFNIGSSYCEFFNNIFMQTVDYWGLNSQFNSLTAQTLTGTFVNANGYSFNYSYNYHLLSSSPGKNFGTDGKDVGLYGTLFPYKDGAVPFNPHIMSKSISGETTPSQVLNVNISVSAQDY